MAIPALYFQDLGRHGQSIAATTASINPGANDHAPALVYSEVSYQQLQEKVDEACCALNHRFERIESPLEHDIFSCLATERFLVLIKMHNTLKSVVDYLAALQSGIVALLIDPDIDVKKQTALIEAFDPNALIDDNAIALRHQRRSMMASNAALLLPTSGSTGAIKHVTLSYDNLNSNARSICDYLPILPTDKAITNLPLFYSYGLSILNTHLLTGACLVFTPFSIVNREFWQVMEHCEVTSMAGVPHTYEMLYKLRFTRRELPYLRYFTQAGGKLSKPLVSHYCDYAERTNKQFFVMYGQTEATARMAYCAHLTLLQKYDTIGKPIPGGSFKLDNEELFYQGPNVMLGYAGSRAELFKFEPVSWLATGDLAIEDSDGDYKITGRKKRFVKVFGHRVDLDQVEQLLLAESITAYCCGTDGVLVIGFEQRGEPNVDSIKAFIHKQLGVHPSVVSVIPYGSLPLLANGKRDYQSILRAALDIPE